MVHPTATLGTRTAMKSPEMVECQLQQGHIEGDASVCSSVYLSKAPPRYLLGCTDEERALERWIDNVEWRKEEGMDSILTLPLPEYETLKKLFPVFICKYCVCVCVWRVLPTRSIINNFIVE